MPDIATEAAEHQRQFYDDRYRAGYMQDFGHVFEATRFRQVAETLEMLRRAGVAPSSVLDYGCGEGRWFPLLSRVFPAASLTGCDISPRGLELAQAQFPEARLALMDDERVPLPDGSADLVISIEVLEHVADVDAAAAEICRLVASGGWAVVTTPCANRGSAEWILNRVRDGFQETPDGYGRFATDEPSHLRRLRSDHLCALLQQGGLTIERTLYSGHVFTSLVGHLPGLRPKRARAAIGMLDWRLFRRRPSGSTMIVIARKR